MRDFDLWGPVSVLNYLGTEPEQADGETALTTKDKEDLLDLVARLLRPIPNSYGEDQQVGPTKAAASARSRLLKTRMLGPGLPDPEGAGVPKYLVALSIADAEQWKYLKSGIESFAQRTGVFDEIRIRFLGEDAGSDSFQVQVKLNTGNGSGQWRSICDVGKGVRQILPVILELNVQSELPMLFLQQPEAHLHPSAQAELGSLLCDVAPGRQILVETHSDHLIGRIRMEVRDRVCGLGPEDVSILYFERSDDDVHIHNIRIDDDGNIVDQPPGYRKFHRHEVNRSLGI